MTSLLQDLPDLSFLDEIEKAKIIDVLTRDEQLRRKQAEKYLKLKQEIDLIESKSIDIPSDHIQTANVCVRCRQTFGYFFNTGDFCLQCGFKVCQKCRVNQVENGFLFKNSNQKVVWLCILCHKYNQYLIQTGDWIFNPNSNNPKLSTPLCDNHRPNQLEIHDTKNSMYIKNNVSKQRSVSIGSVRSNLTGSQLITLSLFPEKQNEIYQEVESVNFKKSTLSKRYSSIKKAKSQSIIHDNNKNNKLNNEQTTPQRKSSEISLISSTSPQTPKLASPDESLSPSNYSMVNITNNFESNVEKATNKIKNFSSLFSFSNSIADEDEHHKNSNGYLNKYVPSLHGDDFDSVTSSEMDNTSIFASDPLGPLMKKSGNSPRNVGTSKDNFKSSNNQINDVTKTSYTLAQLASKGSNKIDLQSNGSNKNLNRDKSTTSLSAFRNLNDEDVEMKQMDQLFENSRESIRTIKRPEIKLAYKRDPTKENVPSSPLSVTSSPLSTSSVSKSQIEMSVDPEEEYLKLQLEQNKTESKQVSRGAKSTSNSIIRKSKNPLSKFERTLSIKSINEHFSHDPNIEISGRVSVKLLYEKKSSNLSVTINKCDGLAKIKKEFPNSYVKVYLKCDNDKDKDKNTKRKTHVVKNKCDPIFDQTLRYTISSNELSSHSLWISVWHKDSFGRNKFLGEVTINLSTDLLLNDSSSMEWYNLGKNL